MRDYLEHISFAEWLIELNICAIKAGYKGQPFTQLTGQLNWYADYESRLVPQDALDNALKDGAEFGEIY